MDRPRWWLIGVAALMAATFLYQSVGLAGAVILLAALAIGFAAYRIYRSRHAGESGVVRCLTCGEMLAPTARGCKYCGSTRWTVN